MRSDPRAERNARMSEMFRGGMTLAQVGNEWGLTRERVRQILKRNGVKSEEGGAAVRPKQIKPEVDHDARFLAKWGCTKEQYEYLRAMDADYWKTPIGKFILQRKNAKLRGIGWGFTLWQWWKVWETSGKWEQRGRNDGEFVMCRYQDAGDYEIGNVTIRTCNENANEYWWRDTVDRLASHSMRLNPERILIDREKNSGSY